MLGRIHYCAAAFALLATGIVAGCGTSKEAAKPVARVAGQPISREQVDETVDHFREEALNEGRAFPAPNTTGYRTIERQALGLIVYRVELHQEAARLGVPVSEAEVARRAKAAAGGAEENGTFAWAAVRAQVSYEHVYRKVTAGLPPSKGNAAMRRFLDKMRRDYAGRVSYERGWAPRS